MHKPGRKFRAPASPQTLWAAFRYLTRSQAQTFAFSVAANAILSFFPFMIVLFVLVRKVFHSSQMNLVLLQLIRDYLPAGQEMVIKALNSLVNARKQVQIGSLFMLLVTSKGVFMPLEVALNHIWGFAKGRNWLHNQIVGVGLAFVCGVLALVSVALTAGNQYLLLQAVGRRGTWFHAGTFVIMKTFATIASITIFFVVYWLLPNGPVPVKKVLPAAVLAGLLWELAKYAYILALPHTSFQEVYGPFAVSVTLMIWAFVSALLLLGGAFLSAQEG